MDVLLAEHDHHTSAMNALSTRAIDASGCPVEHRHAVVTPDALAGHIRNAPFAITMV